MTTRKISKQREKRHSKLHPYLVGYTGKFYSDHRLYPLKMSKKYKDALAEQKRERDTKVFIWYKNTSVHR